MCYTCQMMLLEDHRSKDDSELVPCSCGVFRRHPESKECYHCFNERAELEQCPICDAVPAVKM